MNPLLFGNIGKYPNRKSTKLAALDKKEDIHAFSESFRLKGPKLHHVLSRITLRILKLIPCIKPKEC